MAGTVTLYRRVKHINELGKSTWKNILVNLGRGRRPAEMSGPFYLRYFAPDLNRRVWEHVGDDLAEAIAQREKKANIVKAKAGRDGTYRRIPFVLV